MLISTGVFLGLAGEQWRERAQHRELAENLLNKHEGGRITRRDLVTMLGAMAVTPGRLVAQASPAPINVRSLNHVSIEVKDVDRSVEFYQRVFGLKVKSREGTPGTP